MEWLKQNGVASVWAVSPHSSIVRDQPPQSFPLHTYTLLAEDDIPWVKPCLVLAD